MSTEVTSADSEPDKKAPATPTPTAEQPATAMAEKIAQSSLVLKSVSEIDTALKFTPKSGSKLIAQNSDAAVSVGVGVSSTVGVSKGAKVCGNCGNELEGPFCGVCGQPEKSMIRFFGSVLMHFLDDVFGFDSRAGRTLFPLIFRPGFLTNEYIKGRRVHYVPPVRLYLFISIIFFLVLGFFTDDSVKDLVKLQHGEVEAISEISESIHTLRNEMAAEGYTPDKDDYEELIELLQKHTRNGKKLKSNFDKMQRKLDQIAERENSVKEPPAPDDYMTKITLKTAMTAIAANMDEPVQQLELDLTEGKLQYLQFQSEQPDYQQTAKQTIDRNTLEAEKVALMIELETLKQTAAVDSKITVAINGDFAATDIAKEGKGSKEGKSKPLTIGFDSDEGINLDVGQPFELLSDEDNQLLQTSLDEMEIKLTEALEKDVGPLIQQVLGVLPQTMFFLLPIFALLLKLFYLFSKRFYMEHLTVALHSHAFLFMVLLLLGLLATLEEKIGVKDETFYNIVQVGQVLLLVWVPIYLFLMQKRVYKQGVFATALKFGMVGVSYMMLIMVTTGVAFLWGLSKL
jgi:hypothetical protein